MSIDLISMLHNIDISPYISDMFLKELWQHNKKATIFFLLFIASWIYINYKKGAVAAPMFQYGMYAGKFYSTDTQHVIKVYVNDQPLDVTQYSMVDRDMMQISAQDYLRSDTVNKVIYAVMKRILSKVALGKLMHEEDYTNQITDKKLTEWYVKILEKIIGYPVKKLELYDQEYVLQNGRLKPISAPLKLDHIAY